MTPWLPVALAAGAAAVLLGTPRPGGVRLSALAPREPLGAPSLPLWLLAPAVAGLALGLAAAPVALLGVLLARRVLRDRRRQRERERERVAAVDALSLLAAELRAGRPPADALAAAGEVAAGPSGAVLAAAAATARLGGDVAPALTAERSAVPDVLRGLAACWEVCSATGSGLAAGVERLTEGLRAQEEHRRAIDAELAGPRATAGLLAVLPLAGIGLAAALGADPLHVLLHTPAGLICLGLGLCLDAAGVLWTRWLVARAVDGA